MTSTKTTSTVSLITRSTVPTVTSGLEIGGLEDKIAKLVKDFDDLVNSIEHSFIKEQVSLKHVSRTLLIIPISVRMKIEHRFMEILGTIKSIEELFISLSVYWDYLNPELLEYLVESLGSEKDKVLLQTYLEELKRFRASVKIGEFVQVEKSSLHTESLYSLNATMGHDFKQLTLQDAKDLKKRGRGYLEQGDGMIIASIVDTNFTKIKACFAKLVMEVQTKLMTKNIDMIKFRLYVCTIWQPASDIIPHDSNVVEVFGTISRHKLWDFSHYTPLEAIVKEFGEGDPELAGLISQYKSELAGFRAFTKIIDYIKVCSTEEIADSEESLNIARYDKRYYNRLTIKLKARVTEQSLCYIDQLWRSIAEYLDLPPLSVILDTIEEGCVEVTWLVPTVSALQIEANIQGSEAFLKKLEITCVMMDRKVLYSEEGGEELQKRLRTCEKGEVDEVKALCSRTLSKDIYHQQVQDMTPLLVAVVVDGVDTAYLLLDNRAIADMVNENGTKTIEIPCQESHLEIVNSRLYACGASTSQNCCAPLSTENYVLAKMSSLLNAHSQSGWTALMFSGIGRYHTVVVELTQSPANDWTCIHDSLNSTCPHILSQAAIELGSIFKALLQCHAHVD